MDLSLLASNIRAIEELCARHGIALWGVTKGVSGPLEVARSFIAGGCAGICDSRLDNIERLRSQGFDAPTFLIRIAMPSEAARVPLCATRSMQSELDTIFAIDEAALKAGKVHEVLLAVDVGDLREGFLPEEIRGAASVLRSLKGGAVVRGVAANFACASGLLPTAEKFELLGRCRDEAAAVLGCELPAVSVGGTCCLSVIEKQGAPGGVNELRCGEGMLCGRDTSNSRVLGYASQDVLTLTAEIVECREKPSVPDGEVGMQAFGIEPVFEDVGMMRRALLAIGRQDVNVDRIEPLVPGARIITASSDHLAVDVTAAEVQAGCRFRAGDTMDFRPLYPAMLALTTSRYVDVVYVGGPDEKQHTIERCDA